MELEELKQSWQQIDNRIHHSIAFNAKFMEKIFSQTVSTTIDRLKQTYNSFFIVLTVEVIFLVAVIIGNPFDFHHLWQYVPFAGLLVGVTIAFVNLFLLSRSITAVSASLPLDQYLKRIVAAYDKNKKFEKWFAVTLLAVGLLVPFSFLPNKLERMTTLGALLDTAVMISVSIVLYVVADKLGAFRNRPKERLEKDLMEWEELKKLSETI